MSATADIKRNKLWVIAKSDNVAVALDAVFAGESVAIGDGNVVANNNVPKGHKIAIRDICEGEQVIKYGFAIGCAAQSIAPGDHVHTHNLATRLKGLERLNYRAPQSRAATSTEETTFRGYLRADGRVGVRNEIWIIPTVGCVAKAAEKIAAAGVARKFAGVDGVHALSHPFGCSQLGDDLAGTRSILASLAAHPNVGGVVFIGLGCESNQLATLLKSALLPDKTRIRSIIAQQSDDEIHAGAVAIADLASVMENDVRTERPASDIVIGVKCGGSDGFSGLTANPLVGRMTDRIVEAGGSSILTEIPELFGAEDILAGRCASQQVFEKFDDVIRDFRKYFLDHGEPISENPSPGNIDGGITTLEEKSLGAVQKAGANAVISDVIRYGERRKKNGLTILEAPGNDAVSATALTAAGAQIILFTTGRGTPLGFPAPTIKIASNSELATRKHTWIDFDAGEMLESAAPDKTADAMFDLVLAVASGAPTRNEINDERSIAIWKRGVTL